MYRNKLLALTLYFVTGLTMILLGFKFASYLIDQSNSRSNERYWVISKSHDRSFGIIDNYNLIVKKDNQKEVLKTTHDEYLTIEKGDIVDGNGSHVTDNSVHP